MRRSVTLVSLALVSLVMMAQTAHAQLPGEAPANTYQVNGPRVRSVVVVALDRVSTSCGYAVPLMDYRADRTMLRAWAERRGPDGIEAYWAEKNGESIDGLPGLAVPTRP